MLQKYNYLLNHNKNYLKLFAPFHKRTYTIINSKRKYHLVGFKCPLSSATTPMIRSMVLGDSSSFDFTTITLVKLPILLVLYLTFILAVALGSIGSLGHSGITQPHEENAEMISSGAFPLFANLKTCSPLLPCTIVSKLKTVSSNMILGAR